MTDPTAPEEKAALEWLAKCADRKQGFPTVDCDLHARNALRLLSQPRLPAEPTNGMLVAMANSQSASMEDRYYALYTELTKPQTVTMWEVQVGEKTDGRFASLDEAVRWLAAVRFDPITEAVTITPLKVPA